MSDSVYPTISDLNLKVSRRQVYSTRVQTEGGGRELTIASRTQAVYEWTLDYGYLTAANVETLSAFQSSMGGRKDTFFYSDPFLPYVAVGRLRSGFGAGSFLTVGNGTWTTAYLCDPNGDPMWHDPGYSTPPTGPFDFLPSAGGTLTTGTLTTQPLKFVFSSAPGIGVATSWAGSLLRVVRFADDDIQITRIVSGIYSATVELTSQVMP
jgi:hypothetical protein